MKKQLPSKDFITANKQTNKYLEEKLEECRSTVPKELGYLLSVFNKNSTLWLKGILHQRKKERKKVSQRRRGFPQGSRRENLAGWFLKNNLPWGTEIKFSQCRRQLLVEVRCVAGTCDDPCILACIYRPIHHCSSASALSVHEFFFLASAPYAKVTRGDRARSPRVRLHKGAVQNSPIHGSHDAENMKNGSCARILEKCWWQNNTWKNCTRMLETETELCTWIDNPCGWLIMRFASQQTLWTDSLTRVGLASWSASVRDSFLGSKWLVGCSPPA